MAKQHKQACKRKASRTRAARTRKSKKAAKRPQNRIPQKRLHNKTMQTTVQETQIEEFPEEDSKDRFLYDEVTGGRNKKPVMSVLNKSKLSKYEMDELFCDWS